LAATLYRPTGARGTGVRQSRHSEDAVDPRNRLNELTNREWLLATKSVWQSIAPPRDPLKAQHPATFSEADVGRMIVFFTKSGGRVLDPFLGSGSTLVACAHSGRSGLGIELVDAWAEVARKRVRRAVDETCQTCRSAVRPDLRVIHGDAREVVASLDPASFDFVCTSPPYWNILRKENGEKQRAERSSKGLATHYSEDPADLGNLPSYEQFLSSLGDVFGACLTVLKPGAYMCIVVSDFRHGPVFYDYHADVTRVVRDAGYILEGITILAQDNKNLYAYGRPYRYVPNVHHQYMLLFSRPRG